MINFFWIVLISIVISIIVMAIVVAGLYLFWDSIRFFILKRKIPKDKSKFKDGGKQTQQNDKEVNNDGQFRDYERLREEGLRSAATRERSVKDADNSPGQFTDESGDTKDDAVTGESNVRDTKPTESW